MRTKFEHTCPSLDKGVLASPCYKCTYQLSITTTYISQTSHLFSIEIYLILCAVKFVNYILCEVYYTIKYIGSNTYTES